MHLSQFSHANLRFAPGLKSCIIATKFQPGGRSETSARAETRHVIRPLMGQSHSISSYALEIKRSMAGENTTQLIPLIHILFNVWAIYTGYERIQVVFKLALTRQNLF